MLALSQATCFTDCILSCIRPEDEGQEGMADAAILRALAKAAETGTPQPLDLPPRPSHRDARTVHRLVL